MASKYGIPYSFLLKQIKNANIPIPPSGHWTKLKFNKETTVTPLQGNPDEDVVLYADNVARSGSDTVQVAEQKSPEELAVSEQNNETSETVPLTEEASLISQGEPETETGRSGQENNRYRREILYNEVWRLPIDEVAKKYAISK
ncbi:MAG: hypothetical protein IKL41_02935, partial [Clostridia bacterium]|nr:hypothetical protein [Clostridia bacterium]